MHGARADASDESARDEVAPPGKQPAPVFERASDLMTPEEASDAIERKLVDLAEAPRRVAVAEVAAPTDQKPVEVGHATNQRGG
jgi:hypothetical protein